MGLSFPELEENVWPQLWELRVHARVIAAERSSVSRHHMPKLSVRWYALRTCKWSDKRFINTHYLIRKGVRSLCHAVDGLIQLETTRVTLLVNTVGRDHFRNFR